MNDFADVYRQMFAGVDAGVFQAFDEALKRSDVPEPCKCESARDLAVWFSRAARAAGSIVQRGES